MKKNNNPEDSLPPQDDIVLLEQAFKQFNLTTQRLREAYGSLEDRFAELNVELARKNRELEQSLNENKKMRFFLHNLIDNMPVGVVFVDLNLTVTMFNPYAEAVFDFSISHKPFFEHAQSMLKAVIANDGARHDFDVDFNGKILKMNMTPVKASNNLLEGILVTFQDVTYERRMEESLRKKNTYEVLGEMSAIMAHEFKTPLAGMEGFLALLKRDVKDRPDAVGIVDKITQGTRHLTHIVSELLTFTRPLNPIFEPIDVAAETVAVTNEITNQKNVKIVLAMEPVMWLFDRMLFRQLMFNILSNAFDATTENAEVSIASGMKQETLYLSIHDNGCGMDKETMKHIFKPFYTNKAHGTGLGLSFVWRITDIHNGEVRVESEPGNGTTFFFTFKRIA